MLGAGRDDCLDREEIVLHLSGSRVGVQVSTVKHTTPITMMHRLEGKAIQNYVLTLRIVREKVIHI